MHLPNQGAMEANLGNNDRRTIARSFSQELGDIFRIDNSVADLDEKVDKRSASSKATEGELPRRDHTP